MGAPADYAGICNTRQSFMEGSVVEKEEVELICGVCWPCTCERDWAKPCPAGYSLIGDNTCSADIGYEGQCEQLVSFKGAPALRSVCLMSSSWESVFVKIK